MLRAVLAGLLVLALSGCLSGASADPGTPRRAAQAPPAAPGPYWPSQARYTLELDFDAERLALTGSERIAFANTGPTPLRAVWLRLWGNAAGSCRRPLVTVRVVEGGAAGARRQRCTALEIRLAQPLAPGARTEVGLEVGITAGPRPDRFGRYRGVAYFGNGVPILAVQDARGPRLAPYTDAGESFFSLTSAWELGLTLPAGLAAATTGAATGPPTPASGGRERRVYAAPRARDFVLVVGELQEAERRAGEVLVRHFRFPGTPLSEARAALRTAGRALTAFSARYGPYDRAELDVVEGPRRIGSLGIGMEYPELVLSPAAPRVLVHEVAHQWFYGIVGNDQRREPWLDESFAEAASLRLRGAPCRGFPRGRVPLSGSMDAFFRARDGGGADRYTATVYGRGPCVLRTLSRVLGARRYDRMLRGIVAEHRDGVLTTRAFIAALRAAAPRAFDVDAFLRRQGVVAR